jgi:Holliday junction resolvase RusA-like endonuclease
MAIIIPILGDPIAWQRPANRLMYKRVITWDKQVKEKEQVRWQMRAHWDKDPITAPVRVDITFKMAIPKYVSRKTREQMLLGRIHHMKVPDIDNMSKFYLDCLSGVVFSDDRQVWSLNARKVYSEDPCVIISIISESLYQDTEQEKEGTDDLPLDDLPF